MKLTLIRKKQETPDICSFFFKPAKPVEWKPGQFFHYVLHHRPTDDRGSDRWFTIASAPSEDVIMLTTRLASEKGSSFKMTLSQLAVDAEIETSAIEGEFIVDDLTQEYVFIAGGIGVTPFRAILKDLDHKGQQISVSLLYSNRDQNVAYKEELESFAKKNPKIRIHYITSPDRIDEARIKALIPDLKTPLFYVSGPKPMVLSLDEKLKAMGIPSEHIKLDKFPGYSDEQ